MTSNSRSSTRSASERPETGILAGVSQLSGSIIEHLQALIDLFAFEAQEAGAKALHLGLILLVALLCTFFTYFFFLLFLVFLLNLLFGISWIWICLGIAVIHGGAFGGCIIYLRTRPRHSYFPAVRTEIRKDIETLKGIES